MNILLNFILPIAGFILAVIGAWDKLEIGIRYYKSKRSERVLRRAQKEFEMIEFYSGDTGHLVAYEFKQLFFLLTVIFFASVIDIAPPDRVADNEFRMFITAIFCWLSGFFVGNGVRVANYVIKNKALKEKAQKTIDIHEKITNKSMQPTTNESVD